MLPRNSVWVGRRCPAISVAVFCACLLAAHSSANEAKLAEIRMRGHFHAACVEQLQYGFHLRTDDGWETNAEFFHAGTNFRVNRVDVNEKIVGGKRLAPESFVAAFNGKRQQLRDGNESSLRLEDGNADAHYYLLTPQTLAYAWLQKSGVRLRWDTIVTSTLWEERFLDATYVGTESDDAGRALEVVDFPQRQVKTPCIYRVWFAPDLGYLPVKYVRRVEKTGAVSSTMRVTRFKTFTSDGHKIAIPSVVEFKETRADGISKKQEMKLTVDEASLKINERIDPALFTLDERNVDKVYDVDRFAERLARLEGGPRGAPPARNFSVLKWVVWCNVFLAVTVLLCLVYRRFSKGRQRA